jgi:purine-nucleoside phosphorylase
MSDGIGDALDRLASEGIGGPVEVAAVLGTGLSGLADAVEDAVAVPYAAIPGFPRSGVSGHAGRLVAGRLAGRRVALMQGRAHYYETGDAGAMRRPLEVLQALGARSVLLTNAAGAVNPAYRPGAIVMIGDHINLSGTSPLIGDEGDGRFVPMTDAYDPALRRALRRAAERTGIALGEGVYVWFSGPSFETPAEIRMARVLGADLVGMSTVPEAILARRIGLRLAAISLVTNLAAGVEGATPSHAETKEVAARGAADLQRLVCAYLTEDVHDR